MDEILDWLLTGPHYVQHRTRLDLLNQNPSEPEVKKILKSMLASAEIQALIAELKDWPGGVLKNHNAAKHAIYKLTFLADLGLTIDDPQIKEIADKILAHSSPEGPFEILGNIPTRFGGSGKDEWVWMLCDAPTVLYALIKFGLGDHPDVKKAVRYLVSLVRKNGWPCAASSKLGKFHGPGKRTDPCPISTLLMLKMLSELPKYRNHEASVIGAETLLTLWTYRNERRPYIFGMGTDFKKLKAPLIWYDILHVLDVLSRFGWLYEDNRLKELVEIVASKADEHGRYKAESVWMAWKKWDFGQKREPSYWITFLVYRILKRLKNNFN